MLISGLSFTVRPGQLALLTGPNGSGKTTLLRTITGLSRPESGEIRLDGRSVTNLTPEERGQIAYQAHLEGLKKDLTVEENILFLSSLRGSPENYSEVLAELGLESVRDRSVGQLSAGQKRRCVLAGLKLSGASLWLLDEPLTNLDRAGQALVLDWVDQHLAASGMAVVATHLSAALERPGTVLVEF
jgi:heme exporter protein A